MSSKEDKVIFINGLIDNVRNDILKKVDRMPENWDGWELRALIADYFNAANFGFSGNSKRKKDYKNTCIVDNLI
jgi:hypothetical protein